MKKDKVKRFLIIILMILMIGVCTNSYIRANMYRPNVVDTELLNSSISTTTNLNTVDLEETPQQKLIREVEKYINIVSPNSDKLLASHIVKYSLEYDLDICFVLAQTQIETKFGTAGAGRPSSRHSLFGVCKRYSNYEKAVEDYCKLVRNSYLGKSRTIDDLMRNYVSLEGYRYASSRSYEQNLKRQYLIIKRKTSIYDMQNDVNCNS